MIYHKNEYYSEVRRFKELTTKMYETFKKKRNDYGPSSRVTFEMFGPDSMTVRMFDKLIRYSNLTSGDVKQLVKDESVKDTLLDLANYALITILELEHIEAQNRMKLKSVVIGDVEYDVEYDVEEDDED